MTGASDVDEVERQLSELARAAATMFRSLEMDEVVQSGLDLALEIVRSKVGALYLRDEDAGVFVPVVSREVPPKQSSTLPALPIELVDQHFVERSRVLDEPLSTALPQWETTQAQGVERVMSLALQDKKVTIGLLCLGLGPANPISPSTLTALDLLSRLQAAAIQNAHAHEQLAIREHLAVCLRNFAERAVQTTEDTELQRLLLETALEVSHSDRGLLGLIEAGRVRVVATAGADAPLKGLELPTSTPYVEESLRTSRIYLVEDTALLDPTTPIGMIAQKNGTVSLAISGLRHQGRPVGLLVVGSDEPRRYLPEQKQALQSLATIGAALIERARSTYEMTAHSRQLSAVIEHLPIVVAVLSTTGNLVHINEAGRHFAEYFGVGEVDDWMQEIHNWRFQTTDGLPIPREDLPVFKAFAGQHPPPMEMVLVDGTGEKRLTVLGVSAPVYDDEGNFNMVVSGFQDVSALRELADAKDRFLSIASHELRSPLTSLRATTSLLELDPSASTDQARRSILLQRVHRQVDRLNRLVEQLLDSARLSSRQVPLDLEEGDLTIVCREAIEIARQGHDTHAVILDEIGPVLGRWDLHRLEQVMVNLIGNAIRYSPDGKRVDVQVRAGTDIATIEVIDQGIGIPTDQIDRVFSAFYRGKNATSIHRGGFGLGLYITSEIVRRHGGTLSIDSCVGKGSTFRVTLPRTTRA